MTWKIKTDSDKCQYKHYRLGQDWCGDISAPCLESSCPLREKVCKAKLEMGGLMNATSCGRVQPWTDKYCSVCGGKIEVKK